MQEGSPAQVPRGSARIQLGYTTLTAPISSLTGILQVDDGNPLPAAEATTIVVIAQGKPPADAIRNACLLRLHPILMTTAAALFGALPLMLATGNGAEGRPPLGSAMIGGLAVSQALTLFTTPMVHLYPCRNVVSSGQG